MSEGNVPAWLNGAAFSSPAGTAAAPCRRHRRSRPSPASLSLDPELPARGRSIVQIKNGLPSAGTSALLVGADTVRDGGSVWLCFPSAAAAETYVDRMLPRLGIRLIAEEPAVPEFLKGYAT